MGLNHIDLIVDEDPKCVIDTETRNITSNSPKNTIIQFDHNSERVGFKMKRHIDGHDMYETDRVIINYINGVNTGSYMVDDMTIDEEDDTISFTWLISGNSTKNAGSLAFSISFRCFDDNGAITYNWSTKPCNIFTILSGIEENPEEIPDEAYDYFAKLESEILANVDSKLESKLDDADGSVKENNISDDAISSSKIQNSSIGFYKLDGNTFVDTSANAGTAYVFARDDHIPTTALAKAFVESAKEQVDEKLLNKVSTVNGIAPDELGNVDLLVECDYGTDLADCTDKNKIYYFHSGIIGLRGTDTNFGGVGMYSGFIKKINNGWLFISSGEGNIKSNYRIMENGKLILIGSTYNYNDLSNKPKVNNVELTGNKTLSDLGLYTKEEVDQIIAKTNNDILMLMSSLKKTVTGTNIVNLTNTAENGILKITSDSAVTVKNQNMFENVLTDGTTMTKCTVSYDNGIYTAEFIGEGTEKFFFFGNAQTAGNQYYKQFGRKFKYSKNSNLSIRINCDELTTSGCHIAYYDANGISIQRDSFNTNTIYKIKEVEGVEFFTLRIGLNNYSMVKGDIFHFSVQMEYGDTVSNFVLPLSNTENISYKNITNVIGDGEITVEYVPDVMSCINKS